MSNDIAMGEKIVLIMATIVFVGGLILLVYQDYKADNQGQVLQEKMEALCHPYTFKTVYIVDEIVYVVCGDKSHREFPREEIL